MAAKASACFVSRARSAREASSKLAGARVVAEERCDPAWRAPRACARTSARPRSRRTRSRPRWRGDRTTSARGAARAPRPRAPRASRSARRPAAGGAGAGSSSPRIQSLTTWPGAAAFATDELRDRVAGPRRRDGGEERRLAAAGAAEDDSREPRGRAFVAEREGRVVERADAHEAGARGEARGMIGIIACRPASLRMGRRRGACPARVVDPSGFRGDRSCHAAPLCSFAGRKSSAPSAPLPKPRRRSCSSCAPGWMSRG